MKAVTIQFPFKVKQVGPNEVEIETMTCESLPPLINGSAVDKAFPWLSDEQKDSIAEHAHVLVLNEAIRGAVRIKR